MILFEFYFRLYVCISGAADQLQTNFAGDFRHILKYVFVMNATQEVSILVQRWQLFLLPTTTLKHSCIVVIFNFNKHL